MENSVEVPKKKRSYKKLAQLTALSDFSSLTSECENASLILQHAHAAASALYKAYQLLLKRRDPSRGGMTTDDEQDLLRAMLVMTAAGLDGMTKQLIRDTLPKLVLQNENAINGLRGFIGNKVKQQNDYTAKFLTNILASQNQFAAVTEDYIKDLTGNSLQSTDEILSAIAALGISEEEKKTAIANKEIDIQKLKKIFDVRNKIIHELDIQLSGQRRKRNIRSKKEMLGMVEALFKLSSWMLQRVSRIISDNTTHTTPNTIKSS